MNVVLTAQDWITLRPIEILTVVGLVAMLMSAFLKQERSNFVGWVSILGLGRFAGKVGRGVGGHRGSVQKSAEKAMSTIMGKRWISTCVSASRTTRAAFGRLPDTPAATGASNDRA